MTMRLNRCNARFLYVLYLLGADNMQRAYTPNENG